MDNPIWAAIIAGPMATVVAHWLSADWRGRSPLGRTRRQALSGAWAGRIKQDVGYALDAERAEISFNPKCGLRTVRGKGKYELTVKGRTIRAEFTCRGGFVFERFLMLEYKNAKGHVVQFGSIVFQLSDGCDELEGRYAGYGYISKMPVSGYICVQRAD
jgi:hypothetical protein